MDNIDTNWIEEFEKLDSIYKDFYKEQVQNISLFMVYVDKQNKISFVRKSNITAGIFPKSVYITEKCATLSQNLCVECVFDLFWLVVCSDVRSLTR